MSVRSLRYNTIEQHFTKGVTASTDRDALAFLEAAQIYNANQQRAIVNLVRSLKRVGLWSKMKAIYPFVGGTASSHKFNLKDPRDSDAAFRLTFSGGWTHSANGADPNGTNGYADTYLVPTTSLTENSTHMMYYSRENVADSGVEIGAYPSETNFMFLVVRFSGDLASSRMYSTSNILVTNTNATGMFLGTRTSATAHKLFRNTTQLGSDTATSSGFSSNTLKLFIGARNQYNGTFQYSTKQCAFATIGDGLTDTDATNLYNIVQRYQFQLGRAIEPDAQAFIDAAGITDATQQAAILDLVVRLKNDGLWSKMKAIYPFVGGTATSHKWNLKDPRDVDAAFRLSFQGGWTHSANGADPNGTNGYADTFLPTNTMAQNSAHASYYIRENVNATTIDFGSYVGTGSFSSFYMQPRYEVGPTGSDFLAKLNYTNAVNSGIVANASSTGYYVISRTSSTVQENFKNNVKISTATQTSTAPNTRNIFLGAINLDGPASLFSNRQCAFATIGDGLTDNDVTNLYNIVDLYQRKLGRNV